MPYKKSTQKKYGKNPLKKKRRFGEAVQMMTPFKMKGSPYKQSGVGDVLEHPLPVTNTNQPGHPDYQPPAPTETVRRSSKSQMMGYPLAQAQKQYRVKKYKETKGMQDIKGRAFDMDRWVK